jgi:CHASE2 domain-containing sensor protein
VGIACSLLVTGASALGYLEFLQARTLDLLLHVQGQRFPSEVVIVAIDDAAFESLGRRQLLSRAYLAQLLQGLRRSGAAVVGPDIALTSHTTLDDDATLAQVIHDFARDGVSLIVLAETMTPGSGPLADPAFLLTVVRGSPRVPVDDDGVIRRTVSLVPHVMGPPEPAFSLAIVARLAGMDQVALELALHTPDGRLSLPRWRPRCKRASGSWSSRNHPS